MKNPLIRTIYLYLFALVGLAFLAIGVVRLVNVGLKLAVFTKADMDYSSYAPPVRVARGPFGETTEEDFAAVIQKCEDKCELDEDQKKQLASWLKDYQAWQNQPKIDYKTQQRQRESAWSISFILVGLPLYLYHWRIIRKEKEAA